MASHTRLISPSVFGRKLLAWYDQNHRDLPWRQTRDPYRIWISEIMLQQTRAQAVIPYYHRFLERFPTVASLAAAKLEQVLTAWSGLGYYSRARNLHRAAQQIAAAGNFPCEYDSIRRLAGVGDYTAAAVASIAFDLPHAVQDGNVLRVLARLENDHGEISSQITKARLRAATERLLDHRQPGRFNQALMELGATVCLPKSPACGRCPVATHCQARHSGTAGQLPVKLRRKDPVSIESTLVVAERGTCVLLRQRRGAGRMDGFWELPEPQDLPDFERGRPVGEFRHTITHHHFHFRVITGKVVGLPDGFQWIFRSRLPELPVSTTARKALRLCPRIAKVL